jgi:hypothetical protein
MQRRNELGSSHLNVKSMHNRSLSDLGKMVKQGTDNTAWNPSTYYRMLPPLEKNRFNVHKRNLSSSILMNSVHLADRGKVTKNRLPSMVSFLQNLTRPKVGLEDINLASISRRVSIPDIPMFDSERLSVTSDNAVTSPLAKQLSGLQMVPRLSIPENHDFITKSGGSTEKLAWLAGVAEGLNNGRRSMPLSNMVS